MAKAKKGTKSQAVRDYLRDHPGTANKEVSEALAKQGVKVSPNHVANIKTKSKKRRRVVRKVVSKTGIGIPQVKAAFTLLKACGSMAAANQALAAAQEIRAVM